MRPDSGAIVNAAGTRTTYTWDMADRLTGIAAGGGLVTMGYSATGLRRVRQDGSGTVKYLWDGQVPLMETDGDGTAIARYTGTPGGYGPLVSQRRSSTSRFFHPNDLGTFDTVTDADAATTDTYILDAWGVQHASTGSTTNPFRYIGALGYYTEPDLALHYVRARWLRPATGSWLSVDPVQGEPRYTYAGATAVDLYDPSGTRAVGPPTPVPDPGRPSPVCIPGPVAPEDPEVSGRSTAGPVLIRGRDGIAFPTLGGTGGPLTLVDPSGTGCYPPGSEEYTVEQPGPRYPSPGDEPDKVINFSCETVQWNIHGGFNIGPITIGGGPGIHWKDCTCWWNVWYHVTFYGNWWRCEQVGWRHSLPSVCPPYPPGTTIDIPVYDWVDKGKWWCDGTLWETHIYCQNKLGKVTLNTSYREFTWNECSKGGRGGGWAVPV